MMNLTSRTSKSLLLFKRALVLLCLVLCSLMANAGGTSWNAKYQVKVQSSSQSTGSGTVYITADAGYTNSSDKNSINVAMTPGNGNVELAPGETKTLEMSTSLTITQTGKWYNPTYLTTAYRYENIRLNAVEKDGSTFVGWEESISNNGVIASSIEMNCNDDGSSPTPSVNPTTYHPIFKAKTYRRRTPALKMAIYVPAVEGVSEEQWLETAEESIGQVRINNGEWQSSVDFSIASQLGNGVANDANVSYTIEADAKTGYAFRGWFIHNDDGTYTELSMDSPYRSEENSAQSVEDDEDPYVHEGLDDQTIYAHFIVDRDYYHKRAKVGIASNSEIGKVYVSAEEINDITESEWQSPANGELFTSNEVDGEGSATSDVVAERNALRYDYFFYAQPQDPEKVAFKGWTTNDDGSNITQTDNPYQAIFTASEAPNTAHEPTTMYAVFRSYYYAKPHIIAIGGGKVSLDNNSNNAQLEIDDITSPTQVAANGSYHEYSYSVYAHEMNGSRFIGWSKSSSEKDILEADREVLSKVITGRTSSMSSVQPHRVTWYAIFKSEIDIKHADRMIYYKDNQDNEYINDAKLIIDVYNAKTLDVQLEGPNAHLFQVMDATLVQKGDHLTVEADQGYIELRLKYIGGTPLSDAIGKTVSVKFTSKDSESKVLATNTHTCIVENAPVITFLPTDGHGSYTISHTDGSGISYTLAEDAENSQRIVVTHENMSYLKIEMTDNSSDDRDFFGWEIVEDGQPTGEYISYEKLFTYHFDKSVTLRAEFVPQGWARYVIKSDYTVNKSNPTLYYDLNDAIEQAKKGSSADEKTIVVHRSGLLPKGNYDIPAGVILLVPYEETYSCTTGQKTQDGYEWIAPVDNDANGTIDNLPDLQIFRKLTVEDGTKITVKNQGAICVEAKLMIFGQICIAQPYIAGHLELGDGSLIDMKDGSSLFAWGYITNPENTKVDIHTMKHVGRVNADSGATVWEVLQFNDFRGGSAMMSFVKLSGFGAIVGAVTADPCGYMYEVFPLNQYSIKNVEVPLHLSNGASEMLVTGVYAGDVYSVTSLPFVGSNSGLMTWGASPTTTITKFYDAYKDRQIYVVEDNQNSRTSMKFGDVALSLNIVGQTVDIHSRDYVMPLTNNMDVIVRNAHIELPTGINLCLLAGSSIHLDKQSIGTNYSQMFIYDKDQNTFTDGSGYYGSTDSPLLPIYPNHRPYGRKFDRTTDNLSDAHLIVDGKLNCNNGYLITTSSGANITSNGGGVIQLSRFGRPSTGTASGWSPTFNRNQSIFQYDQTASQYIAIPLATSSGSFYPKLQHADGNYLDATSAENYYYCNGSWQVGACSGNDGYQEPYVDYTPLFSIADPWSCDAWVGEGAKSFDLNISEENTTNVQSSSRIYTAKFSGRDASLFSFYGTTKKINFNPASAGTKEAVMILTATYTDAGGKVYTYTQAVNVVGNALTPEVNSLAFNDLTGVYVGQTEATNLFANIGNGGSIDITIKDSKNQEVALDQLGISDYKIKPIAKYNAETLTPDTFTIIANQSAIQAQHKLGTTISARLIVSPIVVWNWSTLYYPSNNNTNPITMMDGSIGWTLKEKIDPQSGDVVKFEGQGSTLEHPNSTYKAEIFDLITGKYNVMFKFEHPDYEPIEFTSEIYRDVRYVRVDVNNDTVYNSITVGAAEGVEFNKLRKTVSITSPEQATNSWTFHFLGIPDKLYFVPQGDKPWQIEESTDGLIWTTTSSWAYIPEGKTFEFSLMPSTQYVRISYAANGIGTLQDVYITKLEGVKFYPEKLYMPANEGANKNVAITYVSDVDVQIISETEEFNADPVSLSKTNSHPFYNVANVLITNQLCIEQKLTGVNVKSSVGTENLPIQTYSYPQELPIVLASDMPAERFYYVTTHTHNTTWNETNRTITMHNAVANAQPFMTFHFKGAPTYISFNHNADANGEWIIHESQDGVNWTPSEADPTIQAGFLKQPVAQTSQYLRVTYNSLHTCKVEVTNLMIIGEEGASAKPTELTVKYIDDATNFGKFTVTAINLANGMNIATDNPAFKLTHGENVAATAEQSFSLTSEHYPEIFASNAMKDLKFKVYFDGSKAVDYTTITIKNIPAAGEEEKVLAIVNVTGVRETLTNGEINIYTGVPADIEDGDGNVIVDVAKNYSLNGAFEGAGYRLLNINNAFADNVALFDYLFIFGETTTDDGTTTIKTPTTIAGSNAKTPCYIYNKKNNNAYEIFKIVENANSGTKISQDFLKLKDASPEEIKVYITGFCPYASTGYTKTDEGIFFFQGGAGDNVHVYLQDCYLYSRAKTENGHFFENRRDGYSFTENYVQGSGGVLVFECSDDANANGAAFNVTIHTRGRNIFKSHYGCFMESVAGRAYQVSAPVQVHMKTDDFIKGSFTTLNFDDIWPNAITGTDERTNGFISLQKQVNNAPSIDLGNPNTIVNFNGGQVELQNAINVSDNYNSTLAISYRGGRFAGIPLAFGLGSDEVSGTVNFKDGTTTVKEMFVDARYRQYYLMDEDNPATLDKNEAEWTSCLRTPKNTFVYGGSHCMMRACESATSKGGAPTDGVHPLGKLDYALQSEDFEDATTKLVNVTTFPASGSALYTYYNRDGSQYPGKKYGLSSVTSDDGKIHVWIPAGMGYKVTPEKDQAVSFWKACMTYIEAKFSLYGGHVGGDVVIGTDAKGNQTELVSNLLYCEIDQSIREVIRDNYSAPVKSPLPEGDDYLYIQPSKVGKSDDPNSVETQNYILNEGNYQVENKIYYITPATADIWTAFTAPFDVENIYIMETRHEQDLANDAKALMVQDNNLQYRAAMQLMQAKHNADFAAFFGVAMVIHPNKTFDQIFADYIGWANEQDKVKDDSRRNKYELKNFFKTKDGEGKEVSNWNSADYYLYEHGGNHWEKETDKYIADWQFVDPDRMIGDKKVLMKQGETYLMMFPYCVGCWDYIYNEDDDEDVLQERDFWDYWTGKFLIFESTTGPHILNGSSFVGAKANYTIPKNDDDSDKGVASENSNAVPQNVTWTFNDELGILGEFSKLEIGTDAILSGNPTFALMGTPNEDKRVWGYRETPDAEGFHLKQNSAEGLSLAPTQSFLYTNVATMNSSTPIIAILRDGSIVYDTTNSGNQNGTSGHMPTVGGGNDLFITSIAGGINVAVAAPQNVRVLSSTGTVIYSGYVTTAVDIQLPTTGIYIVSGENEVQKILF